MEQSRNLEVLNSEMKNKNEVIDYQKKQIADLELKKQTLKSENTALKNKEANRLKEMSSQ